MAHQCKWFFLPSDQIGANQPIAYPHQVTIADPGVVHRLRTVLRYQPGQALAAVDGTHHRVHFATLTELTKQHATLSLIAPWPHYHPMPICRVTLAVGLIKEQAWDWLLQKATELGVWTIQPLLTVRTVVQLTPEAVVKKLDRWQAVVQSAAEQSEGLFVPTIAPPKPLTKFLQESPTFSWQGALLERDDLTPTPRQPLLDWAARQPVARPDQPPVTVGVLIGPEGGLTPEESKLAVDHRWTPLLIPARILKAETAALVALSQLVMR
jgi:16S rRNA (uracil1498-N3)-methyltransferase